MNGVGGDPGTDPFDSLPDAVLVIENDVIVRANDAAHELLGGYPTLLGRRLEHVLAPGECDRFLLLDAQRTQGWPLPAAFRIQFVRPDGTPVMADARWRRPTPRRLVLTARDVTDVTRAEGLMGRLARLPLGMDGVEAFLDGSEAIFVALGWTIAFTRVVDDGSITTRIIAPEGDPVGDYGRTLVGRVIPRDETPVLAHVVRTGEPLFLDNLPTSAEGDVRRAVALSESMEQARVVRSAWCPVMASGRVTHLLAVTGRGLSEHDFVAVQLFAAQLGAALRLEALRVEMVERERLAAVGAMAAVLAHEVRNPLGIMFNALGGLRRHLPSAAGDTGELLAILEQEAERLKHLVTDLLEFASPHPAVHETSPLAPMIAEVVRAASYEDAFAVASPVVVIDANESLEVHTDASLLRRALLNLVVNAYQHVPVGGRVTVHAQRGAPGLIAIAVANEGPLPPESVQRRMFDPFFTTKSRGTGLGLAIVRRLAHDMRATVRFQPGPEGPTFVIEVPEASHPETRESSDA